MSQELMEILLIGLIIGVPAQLLVNHFRQIKREKAMEQRILRLINQKKKDKKDEDSSIMISSQKFRS